MKSTKEWKEFQANAKAWAEDGRDKSPTRHLCSTQFDSVVLAPTNSATLPRGDNMTEEIPSQGSATSVGG
jgi:hypothetical protein